MVKSRLGHWRFVTFAGARRRADMPLPPLGLSAEDEIRFRSEILDAVGQAVIASDLDGRVMYWNRAAETLFGWSEAEMMGRLRRRDSRAHSRRRELVG